MKYLIILKTYFNNSTINRSSLVAEAFIIFFRAFVLLNVYRYSYSYVNDSTISIDFVTAIWSIFIYFIILALRVGHIAKEITEDIRNGQIETYINKPYNYLLFKVFQYSGKRLPILAITTISLITTLILFVGVPSAALNPVTSFILFIILIFLGYVLAFIIFLIVGLSAFWFVESEPIYWIVDKAILVLGGAYVPIALFPSTLRQIAEYSPFGASMFANQVFYDSFSSSFLNLILIQISWIIFLGIILIFIYKKSLRKLSIHGG